MYQCSVLIVVLHASPQLAEELAYLHILQAGFNIACIYTLSRAIQALGCGCWRRPSARDVFSSPRDRAHLDTLVEHTASLAVFQLAVAALTGYAAVYYEPPLPGPASALLLGETAVVLFAELWTVVRLWCAIKQLDDE